MPRSTYYRLRDEPEREEAEEVEELRMSLALIRRGSGIDAVLTNAVRRNR